MKDLISRRANYQDLIKLLGIILMTIDHTGAFLFSSEVYMRALGRPAVLIFTFFAGYNFHHRINIKLPIYAILVEIILQFCVFSKFQPVNILFTILSAQLYIMFFSNSINKNYYFGYLHVTFLASIYLFVNKFLDYGSIGMAMVLIGYMTKNYPRDRHILIPTIVFYGIIHSCYAFYFSFTFIDYVIAIMMQSLAGALLLYRSFESQISFNFNKITAYLLEFYVLHHIILILLWKYYKN